MKYLTNLTIILTILCVQSIIAQPGWFQQTSGIATDLNAVNFINEDYGFAAGDAGVILKTTNGGSTWLPLTSGTTSDFYDVQLLDQNNGFVVGSGGTILRTTDGGSNWSPITSGVSDNLFSISINGTFGLIGGSSQTILSTTNGGASWNEIQSGFFGGGFWGTSVINSTSGVVAGQNSIFQPMIALTTDTGANWEFTPFYLNTNEGRLHDCHFFDANNGFTVAAVWDGQGAVSRTTNGGVNWITNIFPQALFSLDFPTSSTAYTVGYEGFILKSTNGGVNWESQNSGTNVWLKGVSFVTTEVGYIVGEAGTILKTTAGGVIPVELTSFTASISGSYVTLNWTTATETNNSGFEILRFAQNDSWQVIWFVNGNGTTTETKTYSYKDENLSSGKYQYRLKQIDFDGSFEYSNIIEIEIGLPTHFVLEQNYPNPFNPSTKITWQSPVSGHQTLKIYDVIGNEVATLINETKDAGHHSVVFDATNLSSGIYFYKLITKDFTSTKKMILIR